VTGLVAVELQVRVLNERKRCISLGFKERALVIEATSSEQFEFLLEGFKALLPAEESS
jgi:hypothetical protein